MAEDADVLAITDREALGSAVAAAAREAGLRSRVATSLTEGLRAIGEGRWTATILRVAAADVDLALVARLAGERSVGTLILVVERPSASLAMEATGAGAKEVLAEPVDIEELSRLLAGLAARGGLAPLAEVDAEAGLVGHSASLVEVFKQVGRVGPSAATVLVTGESGTGKELVARAIHRVSPRAARPFVAVNCAAIPEDLLESELFGHERGAFTGAVARKIGRFERASGGTLFLDEIGDMSLVLQAKILRALQEREIERLGGEEPIRTDTRVVAATHQDLPALIARGEFREDLYYRLAVVRLHLAPLRERLEDVRELALHFTGVYAAEYGRRIRGLSIAALKRLEGHSWPGNVRELSNVMERAVVASTGEVIGPEHLLLDSQRSPVGSGESLPGYTPQRSMAEVEALHIAEVLRSVGGHLGRAAEVLGIHRNTVSRKVQEYGIEIDPSHMHEIGAAVTKRGTRTGRRTGPAR